MRVAFYFLFIFILGCWDYNHTPEVKNLTDKEIWVNLNFEKKQQTYYIDSKEKLLFPNLLDEEGFSGMEIKSIGEDEVFLSLEKIYEMIKNRNNTLVVKSGLTVEAVDRFKYD